MKQTLILYSFNPGDLVKSINWIRASGKYVITDPNNNQMLMYLDEKAYNRMVLVAISSEKTLTVLVTPDDSKEDVERRFHPSSPSKDGVNTPFKYPKASKMFSLLEGWKVSESMVSFKRNFENFVPIYYNDIISWLGNKPSRPSKSSIEQLGLRMNIIFKNEGINQLIITFKIYSITILQFISGNPLSSTQDLGRRVRLINGLPYKLPAHFRHLIRSGNLTQIRAILSIFQAYKGFKGSWKDPDLSSISADRFVRPESNRFISLSKEMFSLFPSVSSSNLIIREDWSEVESLQLKFWKDFNPKGLKATLFYDRERLILPLTAGPNHKVSVLGSSLDALAIMVNDKMNSLFRSFIGEGLIVARRQKTFFPELNNSVYQLLTDQAKILSSSLLISDKTLIQVIQQISFLRTKFSYVIPLLPNLDKKERTKVTNALLKTLRVGKLAIKLEAAGKVRVFAISDFWTQNLMKPLHDSLFELLRNHSSDATFNQEGKVKEFSERNYEFIASYDLKSATDLIPVQLYEHVIGFWTTPAFAMSWSGLLNKRDYHFKDKIYSYTRGQPMGTLSSWASLALVHHFIVFLASQRAQITHFRDYLVLGDDIIIANKSVAEQYCLVCKDYGITIGLPKSFVSNKGMFQFASQNIVKQDNISPLSLKEVLACAGHSYYFGEDFNLAKRMEWLERLLRRGFLNTESVVNYLRPFMTASEYKHFSHCLFQGILPSNRVNLIVSILSKLVLLSKDNSITIDQFMSSLRGNIGLFDKTIKFKPSEIKAFFKIYFVYIKDNFKSVEASYSSFLKLDHLQSKINLMIPGTNLVLENGLLNSNSDSMRTYVKIRLEFNSILKELYADLEEEKWSVLYEGVEEGERILDTPKLSRLMELIQELEGLSVRKALFNKVINSIDTKVPFLTKLQLKLLNDLDSRHSKGTIITIES